MKENKIDWIDLLFAIGVTIFFFMPYLTRSILPFGHDTMFHCGRIAMLSEAIQNGKILPAIYPDANYNYGYATPLFYADFFNLIPALLHAAGVPLAVSYKLLVISMSFLSVLTMMSLMKRVSGNRACAWVAGTAYLFSNYHITDIYVRGALGEIIAMAFLPMVLEKIYAILYLHLDEWVGFAFALAFLLLSHNLTFLFGVFLVIIFFFIRIKEMNKEIFLTLVKGTVTAFLLTVFFSLPMLEQLHDQTLNVSEYGKYYDLSEQTMSFSQYFANKVSYGLAGRNVDHPMLENVGWFLTFAPILYLLVKKKDENSFVTACFVLGYLFLLAPSDLLPWDKMHFLGFIQFPWRLNTITMLLLCVPSSYGLTCLAGKKKIIPVFVLLALVIEGGWHVSSNYVRKYGIDNTMNWENIREQNGITTYDPNRFPYKYEEVQGGEYLPVGYPNYVQRGEVVTDGYGNEEKVISQRSYNSYTITVSEDGIYVLPLTWYKGYQVYSVDENGKQEKTAALRSDNGLVMLKGKSGQTYTIQYESTMLRKICMVVSMLTFIGVAGYYFSSGAMRSRKIANSYFR